jgi:hypothetical protein
MSEKTEVGFVSSFPHQDLPEILPSDLMTEKTRPSVTPRFPFATETIELLPRIKSISPRFDFDLDYIDRPEQFKEFPPLEPTWSELKWDGLLDLECRAAPSFPPSFPPELNFALFDEIEAK